MADSRPSARTLLAVKASASIKRGLRTFCPFAILPRMGRRLRGDGLPEEAYARGFAPVHEDGRENSRVFSIEGPTRPVKMTLRDALAPPGTCTPGAGTCSCNG